MYEYKNVFVFPDKVYCTLYYMVYFIDLFFYIYFSPLLDFSSFSS